jgi:SPP1 gp7 family putative phage head morphogenesis protein
MGTSRLQSVISQYRSQLASNDAKAMHTLNTAHAHTVKVMQPHLDKLYSQIAEKQASGEPVPLSWLYEQKRLQSTKDMIANNIDHYGALAETQTTSLVHTGAQLGVQSGMAQLNASKPAGVHFSFGVPHPDAIANIVGATSKGSPLADLFAGFGDEAANKAAKALITGITLGDNPRTIAPLVEDALDISRSRALTIARTEMLRAYRQANLETFKANSDVVQQARWTCDLSPRTCAACLAMDGTLHDLDEDIGFHPNCRCVLTPITASWDDILGSLGIDTSDLKDSSSLDDRQTGAEWFDAQSESTQRKILGNAKYEAYSNGDFQFHQLAKKTSDPDWGPGLTERPLKELVK